jgi:hypothetical protein
MKFARAGVAARPTIALPVRNEGAAAQTSTVARRSAANLNAGETTLAAVASRAHGRSRIDRVARLRIHIAHEQCNEQRNEQQPLHGNGKKEETLDHQRKKKKKKQKKQIHIAFDSSADTLPHRDREERENSRRWSDRGTTKSNPSSLTRDLVSFRAHHRSDSS